MVVALELGTNTFGYCGDSIRVEDTALRNIKGIHLHRIHATRPIRIKQKAVGCEWQDQYERRGCLV